MSHQKRINSTNRTLLARKGSKYIACQSSGAHKKAESMALSVVLRDILSLAKTRREVKNSLNAKEILINGVSIKDHRFAVGFLDEISFTTSKERYIVSYNTLGKLYLKEQTKEIAKPLRIQGKKVLSKGITQINLFGGRNILLKDAKNYSVGDSLILEKNKVKKHIKFEKGAKVFLTSGKHIGNNGTIEEIKENQTWSQPKMIVVKTKDGNYETLRDCAYVVDGEL